MATIINSILDTNPFESTRYRFNTLFRPIQKTNEKESDFLAFIATPVLDYFVLDTLFSIEALIHFTNATVSFLKSVYLWTLNQQQTHSFFDEESEVEFREGIKHMEYFFGASLAQLFNTILSTLSLITRPVASVVEYLKQDGVPDNQPRFA